MAHRAKDVTRTSVQKAIVVIVDTPYLFSRIREKLSVVTQAWFAQKYVSRPNDTAETDFAVSIGIA